MFFLLFHLVYPSTRRIPPKKRASFCFFQRLFSSESPNLYLIAVMKEHENISLGFLFQLLPIHATQITMIPPCPIDGSTCMENKFIQEI
jgi:hypothetical protein